MLSRTTAAALFLAFSTAGCTPGSGPAPAAALPAGSLSGTVAYRERIALPPDAVVIVSIADVARQDAAARTIATARIATEGRQVPIPFTLAYPADNADHAEYAVSARIEAADGTLLFITDTRNPLPPSGRIELMLVSARR